MGVSIAWTTPRKANWGEDYAISLDLESDSSLSNCKVSVFEDDKVITPAPYAVGSIQANRRESLDLYTRNKHWKFYTTHIGWPCHQTEKTFSYFIRFKASHPHGKEFSNRDPVTGNHEVQVVVSPEKLREAHGAFGSFVLEVTLESLATGAAAIVFPPAAIAIVGIAAILHRPIREICLEGVKDPPEFDENYREIDEPKTPQVGDYNISPSDAEKPFGQLAISLAQLYPQLRSFYTTERRIYTANNLRDFEIRRLQTRHIEGLERTLSARLDAVIRSELEAAREVPTDTISPTEHLFDVVDKWTAKQQTESGEDHMEVRSVI